MGLDRVAGDGRPCVSFAGYRRARFDRAADAAAQEIVCMRSFIHCFIYLAIVGIASNPLGQLLPRTWFHAELFPYRAAKWERGGAVYERLGVRKWKDRVPDMSKIMPYMFRKRVGRDMGSCGVERLIRETCVAELTHVLLILAGAGCLFLWPGPGGIGVFLIWVMGNVPDIVIQRYNRPQLLRLYERFRANEEKRWLRAQNGAQRVLILTCNTGEGHNSTAAAMKTAMEKDGICCVVADALGFCSRRFSRFISGSHVWIYRHMPLAFSASYAFMERHPYLNGEKSPLWGLLSSGTDPLYLHIIKGGYGTVVCPHVFANRMVYHVKRKYGLPLRSLFVATDYTCSPGAAAGDADYCCIPDESLRKEFIRSGVPADTVRVTGIPVSPCFYGGVSRTEAKERLGLPRDRMHLLMMCGSMGCGPMYRLACLLEKEMTTDAPFSVTVLCGTNRKLHRKLQNRFGKNPAFRIEGYTKEMPLWMDSADLYLTKPGGLSTTEALVKGLPMVLVNTVSGCESYNLKLMTEKGGALTGRSARQLAGQCKRLLADPGALAKMSEALKPSFSETAAERIVSVIRERREGAERPAHAEDAEALSAVRPVPVGVTDSGWDAGGTESAVCEDHSQV